MTFPNQTNSFKKDAVINQLASVIDRIKQGEIYVDDLQVILDPDGRHLRIDIWQTLAGDKSRHG